MDFWEKREHSLRGQRKLRKRQQSISIVQTFEELKLPPKEVKRRTVVYSSRSERLGLVSSNLTRTQPDLGNSTERSAPKHRFHRRRLSFKAPLT